jgi:hypothetical protein
VESKTFGEGRFHSVGANGYDPVAFVMGGKAVKGKAWQPLTAEAFIKIWTNGQNNWTIGYSSNDASAIGMLALFCSALICMYMSTKCQENVNNLLEGRGNA